MNNEIGNGNILLENVHFYKENGNEYKKDTLEIYSHRK